MADIPPPPPSGPPVSAPPPPPPMAAPPPSYQPGMMPPQGSPGYMPQPIAPSSGGGLNLGAQIRGAAWPIGVGVAGILLPIVSSMVLQGNVYYFYILPVAGVIYGVRAITRGFVVGGIIGIVLNLGAGLMSLTASGLFNPGG